MAVNPISFTKLLKKTDDIYEAVVVSSKRAKQILQDRIVKQMIHENEEISEEGILAEPVVRENIDFDKEDKVTSVALDEFLDGDIDNIALEEGDWIGVFNGDTCVGSWPWQGAYTPVPAMGDDGSQWTAGYLNDGDIPSFKIYDASSNIYYVANPSDSHAFEDFGLWVLDSISVINDCSGELGGIAYFDDCGVCSGGSSGHIANSDQDYLFRKL